MRGSGEGRGRRARTWCEEKGYFQERRMNLKDGSDTGGFVTTADGHTQDHSPAAN